MNFVTCNEIDSFKPNQSTMANFTSKTVRNNRPTRKLQTGIDQTMALGGLTLALFTYILYHFIYPMLSKGLLW